MGKWMGKSWNSDMRFEWEYHVRNMFEKCEDVPWFINLSGDFYVNLPDGIRFSSGHFRAVFRESLLVVGWKKWPRENGDTSDQPSPYQKGQAKTIKNPRAKSKKIGSYIPQISEMQTLIRQCHIQLLTLFRGPWVQNLWDNRSEFKSCHLAMENHNEKIINRSSS